MPEFFSRELNRGEGKAVFDEKLLKEMLSRLEFIILASSKMGTKWGESGDTYGVIGSDLFADILVDFEKGETIFKFPIKGGSSLGTYIMPARAFGILDSSNESDALPLSITPKGKELHDVVNRELLKYPAANWIFKRWRD